MSDLEEEPKYTYYLSKIPKITAIHPLIKEKYDKEVETWSKKKFLESPFISDQSKISGIKYFKPETGSTIERGLNILKKADQMTTNIGNKYSSLPKAKTSEAQKVYEQHYYNNLGGKKNRRTQKNIKRAFSSKLYQYSTPRTAQHMAYKYLGKTAKLYPASNPQKKYKIFDPNNNKWVNFGQIGYEDYTKHHDKKRRKNYLTRTKSMRGNWRNNRYSANNLSRNILW